MDTPAVHKNNDKSEKCATYNVGIIRTDLHSIAVISGHNLLQEAEDCVDSLNQSYNLDPSRTIYVIRDPERPSLASQCRHLCPVFAAGRCVDYSLRRLDCNLLTSISEYLKSH